MFGFKLIIVIILFVVVAADTDLDCKNIWDVALKCKYCVARSYNFKGQLVINPRSNEWCTRLNLKRCIQCIKIFPNARGKQQIYPGVPSYYFRKVMTDLESDVSVISSLDFDRLSILSNSSDRASVENVDYSPVLIKERHIRSVPGNITNTKAKVIITPPDHRTKVVIPYTKGPKAVKQSVLVSADGRRHHKHVKLPDFEKYVSQNDRVLDMSSALVTFLYNHSKLVEIKTTLGSSSTLQDFLNILVDFSSPDVQYILAQYAKTRLRKEELSLMFAEYITTAEDSHVNSFLEYPGVREKLLRLILNLSTNTDLQQLLRFLLSTPPSNGLVSLAISNLMTNHPGFVASYLNSIDRVKLNKELEKHDLVVSVIQV